MLAAVAESLERSLADYPSTIFRVGGDEFLVLFRFADRTAPWRWDQASLDIALSGFRTIESIVLIEPWLRPT